MKKKFFLILIIFFFQTYVFSEEIFLSLKKDKVNVRYGPSFESPIKYIYKKISSEETLTEKRRKIKIIKLNFFIS